MGASVAIAATVLLVGSLYAAPWLVGGYLNSLEATQQPLVESETRMMHKIQGDFEITQHVWTIIGFTLTLTLRNTGDVTFDLDEMELLLNGQIRTTSIVAKQIGLTSTSVWPPQTTLTVTAAGITSNPTRDVVVMDTGAMAVFQR